MQGYFSKTCVLKQARSGYSADGNPLSGILRIESCNGAFRAEVSLINFAPLSRGNYCCVLSDKNGGSYSFPLEPHGGSAEGEGEFAPERGFIAIICYAGGEEYHSVAYCVYGENVYDSGKLLFKLFTLKRESSVREIAAEPTNEEAATDESEEEHYNDEAIADENYYAYAPDGTTEENLSSCSVMRIFKIEGGDTYYRSIKSELDEIFNANPSDYSLSEIYPRSLWIKIAEGEDKGNLIGVIHEKMTVRYICYAVKKREGATAPKHSMFVPRNHFEGNDEGYFVVFRDAGTGAYAEIKGAENSDFSR